MLDRYYTRRDSVTLLDILDRILDKGVVVVGDITVSLCDVELLNIKLKLLIASVDKAREMGIDFGWAGLSEKRVSELEKKVKELEKRKIVAAV